VALLRGDPIYQASKDFEVSIAQSYGYQPIVMRVDQPPFDKPEVRRAMRLICNRDSLRKISLGNLTVPVSNDHPIPPFSNMWMPDQKPLGQDIETAKKLLADAGYKDGTGRRDDGVDGARRPRPVRARLSRTWRSAQMSAFASTPCLPTSSCPSTG
jgi:ABC-type transport system substrate-binding protein